MTACQKPGTQFFNVNQQFIMNYRKCEGVQDTEDAEVQFKCLGDWYRGKNHYFAVVNSRESRIEEKYRCFVSFFLSFPVSMNPSFSISNLSTWDSFFYVKINHDSD